MVTEEGYDGVLSQSELVKCCQDTAQLGIGVADGGRVSLSQFQLFRKHSLR